jgi:hypothetical protein
LLWNSPLRCEIRLRPCHPGLLLLPSSPRLLLLWRPAASTPWLQRCLPPLVIRLHPCHPGALLQSLLLSLCVCHHPRSLLWKSPLLLHLLPPTPRCLLLW